MKIFNKIGFCKFSITFIADTFVVFHYFHQLSIGKTVEHFTYNNIKISRQVVHIKKIILEMKYALNKTEKEKPFRNKYSTRLI